MAGTSFVDADAILKDWYHGDKVYPQFIEATELLNAVEARKDGVVNEVGGRQVIFPLRRGLTQGLGARAQGSSVLPLARRQLLNVVKFPMKKNFARVQIDGDAWRAAMGDRDSFVNLIREETNVALASHAKELNFQLYGDGTGLRSTITALPGGGGPGTFDVVVDSVRGTFEDMLLDAYSNFTAGTVRFLTVAGSEVVVNSVDRNTNTINITTPGAAPAFVVGDSFARNGNRNNEMMGLNGIVNDASGLAALQNITVATNPWWTAFVIDPGVPTAITLENMELAYNAAMQQNGMAPNKIFTSFGVKTRYEQLLVNLKRYIKESNSLPVLDGGYERLSYNNVPMIFDTDCQPDRAYFMQMKQVALFHQFGYEWVSSPDKKNLWDRVEGLDAYEAVGIYEAEFAVYRRNALARIDNILVP